MVADTAAVAGLLQVVSGLVNLGSRIVTATDETKRLADLREFQEALIGLSSRLLTVQQENTTLLNQKNDAEAELKRMKDWQSEKQRYQMVSPWSGTTVWAVQKAMSSGQPPHYLCATCFQNDKASPLQCREGYPRKDGGHINTAFVCFQCKGEAWTSLYGGMAAAKYAEEFATKGPEVSHSASGLGT